MPSPTPEKHRISGVSYALTDDGLELPVVDVAHPAFALRLDDAAMAREIAAFEAQARQRENVPAVASKLMMKVFLRNSVLAGSLQNAGSTFLPGLATYLFKLGPDNLGAWAQPIDRTIAASLPALSMRLRMQDMVELLVEALRAPLAADPARPLHLVSLGGGPSIDVLNVALALHREGLVGARPVRIHAFDPDAAGPSFGARALAALQADGALAGDVTFAHRRYDWTRPETLREGLESLENGLVGVSSEGALFEYADDADVGANLETLRARTPADTVVVGSATSDAEVSMRIQRDSRIPLKPRSIATFGDLCELAGWRVDALRDRPTCRDVRLVKR